MYKKLQCLAGDSICDFCILTPTLADYEYVLDICWDLNFIWQGSGDQGYKDYWSRNQDTYITIKNGKIAYGYQPSGSYLLTIEDLKKK